MAFPPIVKTTCWPDERATAACAQRLALVPVLADALIELHGDLGVGKTAWVRHLLGYLGVAGRVKSPTYGLVEPYQVQLNGQALQIWHFDFYRFANPEEWEHAGFRELCAQTGLKLVEWPEHAGAQRTPADLALYIENDAQAQRQVRAVALSKTGVPMLEAF